MSDEEKTISDRSFSTDATPSNRGPLSVQPVLPSRLLPRVSFRFMLVLTFLTALFYAVARAAGDGGAVAFAIVAAVLFPAACFAVFCILFLFTWAISSLWYRDDSAEALKGSPFAEGQLPPQILPPRETLG